MPDVLSKARVFRHALLARDRSAAAELTRAYGEVYQRIQWQLSELTREMDAARSLGEVITPTWLFQRDRLASLLRQTEAEIQRFSLFADSRIRSAQAEAAGLAHAHAPELIWTGLDASAAVPATFARMPTATLENLVGFFSDNSPLRSLLADLAPAASASVRQSLITGVAMGKPPRRLAYEVRGALGGNLQRALTISRTTTVQAYRESTRQIYEANADVLDGWMWMSALNSRTCVVCYAMHGTVHKPGEKMESHWNCRCVMVPLTKGSRFKPRNGADVFDELSEDEQRDILGTSAFEAYSSGEVSLKDFVVVRRDAVWGRMRARRSLKDALARKAA